MKRLLLLPLFCLPSWGAWSYYYPITYDHTQVGSSDSSDFPGLVYFSANALKDAAHGGDVQSSSGADILFFSDPGLTTQTASELDFYDNVNGIGWFWVRIGALSHSTNGTIYMAVGNASPPTRTTGVWDANYMGVWHLGNGSSLSLTDSSGNIGSFTNSSVTAAAAQIGGGAAFSGGPYLNASFAAPSAVTLEAWVNLSAYPAYWSGQMVLGFVSAPIDNGDSASAVLAIDRSTSKAAMWGSTDGGQAGGPRSLSASTVSLNTWHHLAGSVASEGNLIVYLDGVAGNPVSLGGNLFGGAYVNAGGQTNYWSGNLFGQLGGGLSGSLDEVRVSNAVRSADWILAEYNNQNAPGNIGSAGFWTFGAKTALAIARRRMIVVQ